MQMKSGYKKFLFPVLLTAAAVLCTLPFLAGDCIYIYTARSMPNVSEQKFIAALEGQGKNIKINASRPQQTAIWFRPPEQTGEVAQSPAKYNFIYSDAHYTFDWYGMKKTPIILTPHRDLFEHYTRSNLKTALFDLENSSAAAQRFLEILDWLKKNNKD